MNHIHLHSYEYHLYVYAVLPVLCQHNHTKCKVMASTITAVPRQCHIVKCDGYDGFGFNLYQEKSKPGQFIGKIEPGSPADVAGLKEDDKIVEVNGVNIARENHKQVVGRIKAIASETTLLVVDKECEEYHIEQGIDIQNSLPYVQQISSEGFDTDDEEFIDTHLQVVTTVKENADIVEEKTKAVERQDSGVTVEYSHYRPEKV